MGLASAVKYLITDLVERGSEIVGFTFFKVAPYLAEIWLFHGICHDVFFCRRFSMAVPITNPFITIHPNSLCAKWFKMNACVFPPVSHLICTICSKLFRLFAKNVQHIMVSLPFLLLPILRNSGISTGLSGISSLGRGREQGRR